MKNNEPDKKALIKEAAKTLFYRLGFAKTSMDDIARQCGLAKPTLYYYYPNKEAIFNEIVIDEARQFMDQVEAKLPPDLPADEKIARFFRTIYQDLNRYFKEIEAVPDVLCEYYPQGRPVVEKINELFYQKLRPLLRAGKKEGILRYQDEEMTTSSIVTMTRFLNFAWMRRVDKAKRDRIIETVIEIILNGIRRR